MIFLLETWEMNNIAIKSKNVFIVLVLSLN